MVGVVVTRWRTAVIVAVACIVGVANPSGTSARELVAPAGGDVPTPARVSVPEPLRSRSLTVVPAAERPARLSLVVGGDLLIHEAVWQSASSHADGDGYDFGPMFDAVRPMVAAADLALCHLETPLSLDDGHIASFPVFNAPFELADAVAGAGFDGCSVASNHTLDQGTAGIDATLGHLDRVGVGHAGAARTPEEAATIRTYLVRGRSIAHLSYSYGFNGFRIPTDEPWRTNEIDVERIRAEATRARAEGSDVVVVSLHFGTEYVAQPSAHQRDVVAGLVGSDVDLVIGHHAHVVQPVAVVDGLPVVYGLGNLLSNMGQPERRDGVLLRIELDHEPGARPSLAGVTALATEARRDLGHLIAVASPESWQRTMAVLGADGHPVAALELP